MMHLKSNQTYRSRLYYKEPLMNEERSVFMIKVLAACGNGMGSSQIIKMRIEQVLTKLNLKFKVDHSSIGEAKNQTKNYDLVLVSQQFVKDFPASNEKTKIVGLVNLLSANEIEEKVSEALNL